MKAKTDPTSADLCRAFRELAMEAGYVHCGGKRDGTVDVQSLANALQQGNSTVWTWCRDFPPKYTDLPWIERALGLNRGDILTRAGFVQPDLVSIIESDERITPDFKASLVLYAQAALGRSSEGVAAKSRKESLAS